MDSQAELGDEQSNFRQRGFSCTISNQLAVDTEFEPHVDSSVHGVTSWLGHQRQPLPDGSQFLPKSRLLCDTTKTLCRDYKPIEAS